MRKHDKKKLQRITTEAVEKMRTEYMLIEDEDLPSSLEEASSLLNIYVEDMEDVEHHTRKEILRNNIGYGIGKVENLFLRLMCDEEDDLGYYDQDLGIILSFRALGEMFRRYFVSMNESLTDDNYKEIARLAYYTHAKYLDTYKHLESVRDCIGCACLGLRCTPVGEDTRAIFGEFFKEEFSAITTKGIEKVKK